MAEFLKLKRSNCKNCYRCIRACPVKSIRFSAGQANIVGDECILCGQCFVVCPQNAKEIASGVEQVKVLLAGNAPVYASVAPSFIANYNGAGIEVLETGLKALGFAGAEETAIGATHVKTAYEQLLRDGQRDVLISSCCHSINLLIQNTTRICCRILPTSLPPCRRIVSTSNAVTRMPEPCSSGRAWPKGRGRPLPGHRGRGADL